jgi:hypothetical protein
MFLAGLQRSLGIVHSRSPKSNSSHLAPITSPVRAAVKMVNSRACAATPSCCRSVRQKALPLLREELAHVYSAWASQFDPKRTSNFNGVGRGPSQRPAPRKSISFGPEPEAIRFRVDLFSVAKAIAFAAAFEGKIDACADDG